MSILAATLQREWQLAWRNLADAVNPVAFFLMVIALVPLGIGTDKTQLASIAPGMLWVSALLASLLSVDMLFRRDYDDGTLEQYLLLPNELYGIIWIKVLVHWLFTGLPLVLISPLLGMMLSLQPAAIPVLMQSLALGTISLSLIGAIGASLTVSLRRGGLLIAVIVLPLYIPVLIFGASATAQAVGGIVPAGQLAMLGAFALLALGLSPLVVMAGLRIAVES
ncbi:MAG TPA: heme exporter protein CcmB [Pseudomonadales bacterium]|nr:heme exporter protein CcmB [Pseudomonadales bacterium]